MAKIACLTLVFLLALVRADMTLDRVDREILKFGLHRMLRTNVTYTTDLEVDLKYCSFVFRENITSDLYVYYEEVTRDMPGFETWPHHLPMNIEAPAQKSEPQDFIWRLPLSAKEPNSFVKHFVSSQDSPNAVPQTNTVTVEWPIHFRYQPVQSGSGWKNVTLEDPKVFIDCRDADLRFFRTGTDKPIID